MKKTLSIILLVMTYSVVTLAQRRNADYDRYIATYSQIAVEQMRRHGIPASITLAQGLLESGAGKSSLASKGNNHFGIKCHDWTGKRQYHDDDEKGECFRVYNNATESFEDHSLFLKRRRYQDLFSYNTTDYKSWAYGLKACGYATSPTYAQSLINIIETYELYKYDSDGYQDIRYYNEKRKDNHDKQKDNYDKYAHLSPTDHVQCINGKLCIRAQKGDTYKTIGSRLGISYRKLARYNERSKKAMLTEGEIVFLQKKARKGEKQLKGKYHIVKAGESMHSISQQYGIRLKRLYKINYLSMDSQITVGQPLRLR